VFSNKYAKKIMQNENNYYVYYSGLLNKILATKGRLCRVSKLERKTMYSMSKIVGIKNFYSYGTTISVLSVSMISYDLAGGFGRALTAVGG
jgi:hypothetical protein